MTPHWTNTRIWLFRVLCAAANAIGPTNGSSAKSFGGYTLKVSSIAEPLWPEFSALTCKLKLLLASCLGLLMGTFSLVYAIVSKLWAETFIIVAFSAVLILLPLSDEA